MYNNKEEKERTGQEATHNTIAGRDQDLQKGKGHVTPEGDVVHQ